MTTNVYDRRTSRPAQTHLGLMDRIGELAPAMHALLRIGAGLLFMEHGAQKLFGWFGAQQTVQLMSLMGLAGVLETFGGLLLVLGLLTRPVAFLLAGEMVSAFFIAHFNAANFPAGWVPIMNKGELALLYSLVWGYFFASGGGPFSVDAAMKPTNPNVT